MSKQIAKLLKADLNETGDLKALAKMLQTKGRGNDTILAHITQREAEILKAAGGSGTINPHTGLPEFDDYYGDTGSAQTYAIPETPQPEAVPLPPVDTSYIPASADNQASPGNNVVGYGTPEQVVQANNSMPLQSRGADLQPENFFRLDTDLPDADYKSTGGASTPPPNKTPDKDSDKPWYNKLSTDQMIRLGLMGGLGLYGAQQSKKAAQQGQQRAEEMRQLGAPYQQKGAELQRAAAAGELTPASQQALQALQARLAQGVEQRGGVGEIGRAHV